MQRRTSIHIPLDGGGPSAPAPLWPPPDHCIDGRQARSGPHMLHEEHFRAVDELRAAIAHMLPISGDCRRLSDEDLMIRYLVARQWKVEAAREMLEHALEWRKKEGINDIFEWAARTMPVDITLRSHCQGICGLYGCDQEGNPVMWERPSANGAAILLKEFSRADVIKWNISIIERSREMAKALNVDRYTCVVDLCDLGLRNLLGDAGSLLKEQSKQIQEVLPEAMRKMFIVNAPMGFSSFWSVISVVLDKRVQEKISIKGKRYQGDPLSQWVPIEETPVEFNGEAIVDWEMQRMKPDSRPLTALRGCPSYCHKVKRVAQAAGTMLPRSSPDAQGGSWDLETALEWDSDDSPCAERVEPRCGDTAAALRRRSLAHDRPPALAQLQVGTRYVRLEEDRSFALLRQRMGLPDSFLKHNFDFDKMAPGGGKGGDCMARSNCKQWWVKDLNPGDYAALTSPGFLEEYVDHVTSNGGRSLICRLVALLNDEGRRMIVMSNCLPTPDTTWGHLAPKPDGGNTAGWSYLFDLKGNRDDKLMQRDGRPTPQVHKRCWQCNWLVGECLNCPRLCCLTPERQDYMEGKQIAFTECFHLSAPDSAALREVLEADVRFFQRIGLMDYSAIVGVIELRPGVDPPVPARGQNFARPYTAEWRGRRYAYYWGIIDFLQLWTCGKKAAHVIKWLFAPKPISTVEPTRYGEQFMGFVRQRVLADGQPLRADSRGAPQEPPGGDADSEAALQLGDVSPAFVTRGPDRPLIQ
eukprot:TRINITY_DN14279_c0_g1_i1.p1 TRINITY_DN14279_c0_g1~~TRINITY_DN14279_c0_g1_i1.p1  ORF type:complete len:810 (+),score=315.40 TRINITY_DN14279_c0_g1_i1:172-2430(+)